jgi:hypothetical protein
MPLAGEGLAKHRLRFAGGVHVRGVNEIDPGVERAMHDAIDFRLVETTDHLPHLAATAERHRSQTQLGHEHAGIGQLPVLHRASSL